MKPEKKHVNPFVKFLRIVLLVILILVLAFAAFIGYLTATEYYPQEIIPAEMTGMAEDAIKEGDSFTLMSWNIGYGALGDNADFFMDGGESVQTADKTRVNENLATMSGAVQAVDPDILFLQEADIDSTRSHHINEVERFAELMEDTVQTFAYNFKVPFVPYPLPPIGKVQSGIATFSPYPVTESVRFPLPCPFSWPIRVANLKRCMLVDRVPLEGSDKELVLVNFHLEAYDDGEGKEAQTAMLKHFLDEERDKGNYVIAGGDFNQTFSSVDSSKFPVVQTDWLPGIIDTEGWAASWQFLMDKDTPSCRTLSTVLATAEDKSPEAFQYYIIDGFIVSDNIKVDSFEILDLGFKASDHNPAVLKVTLK